MNKFRRALLICATLLLLGAWTVAHFKSVDKARLAYSFKQVVGFALSNAPAIQVNTNLMIGPDPRIGATVASIAARSASGRSSRETGFHNEIQARAFWRLRQQVGPSFGLFLRPESGTAIQIKGNPLARVTLVPGSEEARHLATAGKFLRDNAQLLLIDSPEEEFHATEQRSDDLGGTTIRYAQTFRGLPVWPAEIGVHLDAAGDIRLIQGAYQATPSNITTQPTLSAEEALNKALSLLPGGIWATAKAPSLIIYAPLDRPPRLGWKTELNAALDRYWSVVIDATDGATLRAVNLCMSGNVSGSGTDLLGVTVPLNVWQTGTSYYLWDASKDMFNPVTGDGVIYTYDAMDSTETQVILNNTLQNLHDVVSSSATSWSNPNAVSAAYNLSKVYDYYFQRFGRNSYNGNGSNLVGVVRIGQLHNAFWHWGFNMMFFGDADRYPGSLDVIGHEVTHGLINSIGSQGILDYQNQPGALNEAFADIFGEMVEAHTRGTNDWLIGSQLVAPVRNLANPEQYGLPAKLSQYVATPQDNGGVHENSGIFEHAYFLLAAGLSGAIGNRDAEAIFYRSLTQYLQPVSQFVDARLACIAAAEDLYGQNSVQAAKTAEAFDAVEMYGAPASASQPSSVNAAVQANDSILFIRKEPSLAVDLWRYERAQNDSNSGSDLVTNVKVARPTVTGNGAGSFFCGSDEDLYFISTLGTGFTNFHLAGLVHSVSVSPDGHYVALVLNSSPGIPTNQISLIDLWSNTTATVGLVTPVTEGPPLANISYAGSLEFSPDSKLLIYDALSTLKSPDGSLHNSWSIFALDTVTLTQYAIVPPNASFQFGNPAFGHTSDRFISFDAQFVNGTTAILTLDLYRGTLGFIGISQTGLGYPCFNGDDSFLVYADQDNATTSGRSIYAQELSADKMSTNSSRVLWWNDARLAIVYRRGTYSPVDTAPAVTLISPAQNASFTSPATVTLSASASHIGGPISRVDFYNGNTLLSSVTSAPYTKVWTNVPTGIYRVYARAFDGMGASSTSPSVLFNVQPTDPLGVPNRSGEPGFEFSLRVPQPGLYRLETSTNLIQWMPLGSFVCTTNLSFWDQQATNYKTRFYRAVATP